MLFFLLKYLLKLDTHVHDGNLHLCLDKDVI